MSRQLGSLKIDNVQIHEYEGSIKGKEPWSGLGLGLTLLRQAVLGTFLSRLTATSAG